MANQQFYGFPKPTQTVFPAPIIAQRAPTTSDIAYPIGQTWVDESGNTMYGLVDVTANTATWDDLSGGGAGGIATVNGDSGSCTGSDISIISGQSTKNCGQTVAFSGATDTLEFNVSDSNNNTIIGRNSGNASQVGFGTSGCVSIGCGNLTSATGGSGNIAVGDVCLVAATGNYNTAVGSGALNFLSTGSGNVSIGASSLNSINTGSNNVCIGKDSGAAYDTGSESSNICINSQGGVSGESNVLRIGASTGTTAQSLNKAFICGISGITVTGSAVLVSASDQLGIAVSSRKYKDNIKDMNSFSNSIMNLRPVTFNYKNNEDQSIQCGLIAEEVEEVLPSLVVYDKNGDAQTVKYHDLPILLLNELQKSLKRIELLEKVINLA